MSKSRSTLAAAVALTLLAVTPALAFDVGNALALPASFGLDTLADALAELLSIQLLVGFGLGIVACHAGRVAWVKGKGAFNSLLTFGTFAARYGAVAGVLGVVLYFV